MTWVSVDCILVLRSLFSYLSAQIIVCQSHSLSTNAFARVASAERPSLRYSLSSTPAVRKGHLDTSHSSLRLHSPTPPRSLT